MRKWWLRDEEPRDVPVVQQKCPRHSLTIENTPEETIRRMQAFPERAAKLRELIRALREKDENLS